MNVFLSVYLFLLLITISWCHNRIVNYQGLSLKEMLSSRNVPLRADFPGLSCFTLKLHPIQQPFQCSWDTNPCHCSYHRARMSIKTLHYIFVFKGSVLPSHGLGPSIAQSIPLWSANFLCYWDLS